MGTFLRSRGPMYSDSGRFRRLSAYCSRTCAVQPAIRASPKSGVIRSVAWRGVGARGERAGASGVVGVGHHGDGEVGGRVFVGLFAVEHGLEARGGGPLLVRRDRLPHAPESVLVAGEGRGARDVPDRVSVVGRG